MHTFLQELLTVGVTAGWIVAVLLLLRLVLKKAPRWITVCLWALVALRLLVPVTLQSPVSLVPSTQVEQAVGTVLQPPPETVPTVTEKPVVTQPTQPTPSEPSEEPTVTVSPPPFPWDAVLLSVWAAGVVGMLLYAVITTVALRLRMRDAVKLTDRIYQSDRTASPFVLGVFRPRIYLPYGLDTEERLLVQAHEETHIRRGDHLWKPLGFVLLAVYWFQPLLWVAYGCLCRDIEAACDERVIRSLSPDERKQYSYALLTVGQERRRLAACPVAFGETDLKERVKRVKAYKKPAVWVLAAALLLAAAAAVCLLTNRIAVPPSKGTFDEATLRITSDPLQTKFEQKMDVAVDECVTLEDGSEEPLEIRVDSVDVEEMEVVLRFSKPLWVNGVQAETVSIPYDSEDITLCSDEGEGEERYVYTVRLSMPSSTPFTLNIDLVLDLDAEDDHYNRTVYRGGEWELTLYPDLGYFAVDFGRLTEHTMRGTYQEIDGRYVLTEDAGVTEYVFEKEANGRLRYIAEESYRHKKSHAVAPSDGLVLDHFFGFLSEKIGDRASDTRYRVKILDFDGRVVVDSEDFSGNISAEALSSDTLRLSGYYDEEGRWEIRNIYVDLAEMKVLNSFDRVISDTDYHAVASLVEEGGKHYVRVVQSEWYEDTCADEHAVPIDAKFRLFSVGDIAKADVKAWLSEKLLTISYVNKVGNRVTNVYNWHTKLRVKSTVHTVGGSTEPNGDAEARPMFEQDGVTLYYSGVTQVYYHLGGGEYADLLLLLEDGTLTLDALRAAIAQDMESGSMFGLMTYRDGGTRTAQYDADDASQGVTLRSRLSGNRDIYIGDILASQ